MEALRKPPGPRASRDSANKTAFVSAEEAHKNNAENLWVCVAQASTSDEMSLSFRIPSFHPSLRLADLLEVQRQAGLIQAHRYIGVSRDHVFILQDSSLNVEYAGDLDSLADRTGTIRVRTRDVRRISGKPRSASHDYYLRLDSGIEARGSATAKFLTGAVYERVRANSPHVSDRDPIKEQNDGDHAVPLVTDPKDPILVDHESDHYSAMAVVCGIEGLMSRVDPRRQLTSLSVIFTSYIEPQPQPLVKYSVGPVGEIRGSILQDNVKCATFRGTISSRATEGSAMPIADPTDGGYLQGQFDCN